MWNGVQWVPNVAPAPGQPAGMPWARPYESGRFRARMATLFLAANIVGLILLIPFDLVDVTQPASSQPAGDTQVILVGLLALLALIVYFGSFIPAIVFMLMWVHRVVRNMPALGSFDPRWSPSGAVVRCVIPIVNLVHPMRSTLDAWRGADPSQRWLNVTARTAISPPPAIVAWWSLWLVGNWISLIGSRLTGQAGPTGVAGAGVVVLGTVLVIGAGVFAIQVIRGITARQDQKNELIATGQLR